MTDEAEGVRPWYRRTGGVVALAVVDGRVAVSVIVENQTDEAQTYTPLDWRLRSEGATTSPPRRTGATTASAPVSWPRASTSRERS